MLPESKLKVVEITGMFHIVVKPGRDYPVKGFTPSRQEANGSVGGNI